MLHRRNSIVTAGLLAITALTAAASPTPTPAPVLNSGTEGAKAALVRIELVALSEIAHVNSSSGRAEIARGRSEVPLGAATGVLVSADGIVATTWENLALDEGAIAVQSANDLFSNVIRVPIVGNDGNSLRRGTTPDEFWAPHLQHCYDLVDHCILFKVPQYRIRTYTSEPGSVVAELLNRPSAPQDVALLQITGGGGAPTATLAPPTAVPSEGSLIMGFLSRPPAPPSELPVNVDLSAGRISSEHALGALLNAGASGGPVIDGATGQVLGLAGPLQADGQAVLTPVTAIQSAMADAGVETSISKFDAVFRRGIDHLAAGNQGGSAVSALEESLTYYDSALAANHLERARAGGASNADGESAANAPGADSGWIPTALLAALAGALLLGGILAVMNSRRRKAAVVASNGTSIPGDGPRHGSDTGMTAPGGKMAQPPAGNGQPAGSAPPGDDHQPAHPPREGRDSSVPAPDLTRAAGPFALRAASPQSEAGGQSRSSCPHCGDPVQPGARFCTGCGQPLG